MQRDLYKIGLNISFVGKPDKSDRINFAVDWRPQEVSLEALAEHISNGHAFSAHFKDGYRKTANFLCSDFIAADFDGTMRLDEALQHPFVKKYAALVYTTASHSADQHRFRVVFLLDEIISTPDRWANALKGLALWLGSDPSIKDAGRMFFGSLGCQMIRIGKTLPLGEVEKLIALAQDYTARSKHQTGSISAITSNLKLSPSDLVTLANGQSVELGMLPAGTGVRCPYHDDEHPSAHLVRSKRGVSGIHCMACDTTFWTDQGDPYDFEAFDRLVKERQEIDQNAASQDDEGNPFSSYFPNDPTVTVTQTQFLEPLIYRPGVTVIKSPKGSGKTEAISAMVEQIRDGRFRSDMPKADKAVSILLVGHRQSLIKEAANRLGIECYLDDESIGWHRKQRFGYAICLDSLPKLTTPGGQTKRQARWQKPPQYDVVILDESEQVISHLLSETLRERNGMGRIFASLEFVIRRAKAVYALDADLGLISLHALKALRSDDWNNRLHIIHNQPLAVTERRPMTIYKSRKDLQVLMLSRIREGKRCFIASNSKATVNVLDELIRKEFGSSVKVMTVTSENSRGKAETHFVQNIQTEYLKKQVLICSPSLGTGIDISFPDGRCEVDEVLGFFSPHVNKHTDIDQQLSRVRNPGAVSVWFDGGTANYETHLDVIREQLAAANFVPDALSGKLDDEGRPAYDPDHPLLNIAAHVMVAQRSSQNRIQELFRDLRAANGWDSDLVEKLPTRSNSKWKDAQRNLNERRIAGILAADIIDDSTAIELSQAYERGAKLTKDERFALDRYQLERDYRQPVTRQLIEMDRNGKLREQIAVYRQMFGNPEYAMHFLAQLEHDLMSGKPMAKNPVWVFCAAALTQAGLIKDGKLQTRKVVRADELDPFKELIRTNRVIIEEVLQQPMRNDFESNPIRQLNAILDQAGLKLIAQSRRQRAGSSSIEYRIDGSISKWIKIK